jgi:hypothetical protein
MRKRTLIPKETAKAAYPKKQVMTWMASQLLCSAGINGFISAVLPGRIDDAAMAMNANAVEKVPMILCLKRNSSKRYMRTMVHEKKISDSYIFDKGTYP